MKKLNNRVIIWGNDNYNVLGLLRQLTPYVKDVLFLVNKKTYHCATNSKYCTKYHVVLGIDEGIDFLLEEGTKYRGKAFIITSSDMLAEAIDLHREVLTKSYILCTTDKQGVLTKALDKNYQYVLAEKVGIRVPFSKPFKTNSAYENIQFPCLIKPAFKQAGVFHPFKTKICSSNEDLIQAQVMLDKNGTYVLQQYVNKEKEILVYGCRFNDGTVAYAGAFTKYRWSSSGDGSYGIVEHRIPSIIDVNKLSLFLQSIDYFGLFSAEFGVENGTAWFYEFNLRNDGTSHYFYQAGIANLPLAWIKYNLDGSLPQIVEKAPTTFIDEIGDYENVKKGIVSKADWQMQHQEATVFKYYSRKDKIPFVCVKTLKIIGGLYHSLKDIFYHKALTIKDINGSEKDSV